MPIYEYKCAECESRFEKMQKVGDAPPEVCAHCGGKLEKQWSLSGFQLKGAGWYVTDYSNKGKSEVKTEAKSENTSESKTDAKSESKSETSAGGEKSSAGESTARPKTASNSAQSDNSTVKKSE